MTTEGRPTDFSGESRFDQLLADQGSQENHTFRRLREGVIRRAEQLGYGVEEFWLQQPTRPERLKRSSKHAGFVGLF